MVSARGYDHMGVGGWGERNHRSQYSQLVQQVRVGARSMLAQVCKHACVALTSPQLHSASQNLQVFSHSKLILVSENE